MKSDANSTTITPSDTAWLDAMNDNANWRDTLPFFPYRFMAIDMGSNAIKARVWEIEADGSIREITQLRYPVRVGQGVFIDGMITRGILEEIVSAFHALKKEYTSIGCHSMHAVATSAMREASNALEVERRVRRETEIHLEILPGAEEARLIALGVLGVHPLLEEQHMLIDIGGGSTEIILASDPDIISAQSVRLGAVRIKEMFFDTIPPTPEQLELAENQIGDVMDKHLKLPRTGKSIRHLGGAGTITAIKGMIAGKSIAEVESGDAAITLEELNKLVEEIRYLNREQIIKSYVIEEKRAEIILAGALILRALMVRLEFDTITTVKGGVSDGLLQSFLERAGLRRSRLFDHNRAFLLQANALGEHYQYNRSHGMQVSRLAISIFDQLKDLHGLGAQDRMILKGAAILHEIGQYVAFSSHHKHSQYLIMNSDLPGLTELEKIILGCVARYHRKAMPKKRHPYYAGLDPASQARVCKMAAILRIADALDREQQSLVREVHVRVTGNKVEFNSSVHYRAAIEVWNASEKADLFKKVFKLVPVFLIAKL